MQTKTAMKKEETSSDPMIAKNGELYALTKDGKVKKLNKLPSFISLQDAHDYNLEESIEEYNTKCLAKFLKQHLEGVEFKRGVIKWRGFKAYYVENGFTLEDTYSPEDKFFVNEYPSPADVLKWFKNIKDRKVPQKEKEVTREISGLKEKFIVKVNDAIEKVEHVTRKSLVEKEQEDKNRYPNTPTGRILRAQDKFFEAVDNDKSVRELTELVKKVSSKASFIKSVTPMIKQFRKKEITKSRFVTSMKHKMEPFLKEKTKKPQPVPRYIAPDLWEPYNIEIMKGDEIAFLTRDPAEKGFSVVTEKHLYYVNQVLARWPKAMTTIMKIAAGEKVETDYLHFKRDLYVAYDEKVLKTTSFRKEIIEFCDLVLKKSGEYYPTIFDRKIEVEGFKKGDHVEVYFPDYTAWFTGKIISVDFGIKVLYDDGDCLWVLSHQKVNKIGGNE